MRQLHTQPKPRSNIVAGEPVKWRVKALDVLLRPWFAHGPHQGMAVLTTVGRRSGKPRRHCVRAIRKGNRVYLVAIPGSHASWLSNIRTNPRVSLQVRGTKLVGMARELAGTKGARVLFREQRELLKEIQATFDVRGSSTAFRKCRETIMEMHEVKGVFRG